MDIVNRPFETYTGDESYIFVSYAHKDSQKVYPIMKKLYDMDIVSGTMKALTQGMSG